MSRLTAIACLLLVAMSIFLPNGQSAYADAPADGNVTFSVPTRLPLAVKANGSLVAPSSWETVNLGSCPLSITNIEASDSRCASMQLVGVTAGQPLSSASGKERGIWSWNYQSGFNAKEDSYASAGAQRLLPAGGKLNWTWNGSLSFSKSSAILEKNFGSSETKLLDLTFTYRAQLPIDADLEIVQTTMADGKYLDLHTLATNTQGMLWQWYRVEPDGTKTKLDGETAASYKLKDSDAGKSFACEISDPSYWTYGTVCSEPFSVADKFAVFSADDGSLTFYDRGGVPSAGQTFDGKTASAVYTGLTSKRMSLGDADSQPWADVRNDIRTVSFADVSRPTCSAHWFDGCKSLTAVDVTNLDFSNVASSASMFQGCVSLASVNVERLRPTNLLNASSMFQGCSSLESLDVSQWKALDLWNTGAMFMGCTSLKSVDLSGWPVSGLVVAYSMFQNCTSLTSIGDTSTWQLSALVNPSYMFTDCHALNSLDTARWNMQSATSLEYMFDNCYALGNIDVSGWDVRKVADIEWAFNGCKSMTGLDVSKWSVGNVVNMQGCFANMDLLATLDVGDWDLSRATDISYMFNRDASLRSIDVSNWNVSSNGSLELTFMGCSALESLDVSSWNTAACTSLNYTFGECPKLNALDVSGWDVSNVGIFYRTFYLDKGLDALDLSGWTNSSATNWIDFAKGCENVAELDLSGIDNSNAGELCGGMLTDMHRLGKIALGAGYRFGTPDAYPGSPDAGFISGADGMWYSVTTGQGYAPADIPAGKADTYVASKEMLPMTAFAVYSADDQSLNFYKRMDVPSVGDTFEGRAVTAVFTGFETSRSVKWHSVWDDIKSVAVVDTGIRPTSTESWFEDCKNLVSVDLGKLDMSRVQKMGGMFLNCEKLTSIDLSQVGSGSIDDMSGAFYCCMALKSIDLSGLATTSSTDMTAAFTGCRELAEITLGESFVWGTGSTDLPSYTNTKWKADSDGALYSSSEIPSGKADTYRLVVATPSVPDKPVMPDKPSVPDSGGSGSSSGAKDAASWTLGDQQAIAEDISAKGEASAFYAKVKAAMDAGTTWSMQLTDGSTLTYRIVGINHDDLADGSGKAGLTFEATNNVLGAQRMNATSTNAGGWEASELRAKMNSGEIWNLMPADFQSKVKSVRKMTDNQGGGKAGSPTATVDKLFLLSSTEVYGNIKIEGNIQSDGSQYEYYVSKGVTSWNGSGASSSSYHWTRSVDPIRSNDFRYIGSNGVWYSGGAMITNCVFPAWCF